MACDMNRSINVGFLSSMVIYLIAYFAIPEMKLLDTTKLLFLFVVFFVKGTSMDYFNYCYTECANIKSSLTYGTFTIGLIYLFFSLFVGGNVINKYTAIPVLVNIGLLSALHYFLCDIRYLKKN